MWCNPAAGFAFQVRHYWLKSYALLMSVAAVSKVWLSRRPRWLWCAVSMQFMLQVFLFQCVMIVVDGSDAVAQSLHDDGHDDDCDYDGDDDDDGAW